VEYTVTGVHTRPVTGAVPGSLLGKAAPHSSLVSVPENEDESSSDEDTYSLGQESLGNHARWPQVKELLDKLETRNRVRAVKDISVALNKAAVEAEAHMKELEELERTDAEDESNLVIDEELLKFRTDNTTAIQAIKRCIDVAPDLYKRVSSKLDTSKQLALARAAADAEHADGSQSCVNSNSDSDEEDGNAKARSEVLNRLQRLGTLPRSADKELHLLLEVQREEIRTAAQRSSDNEKRAKVARLAIEYIDGNVEPDSVDPDLLSSAITLAQELKSSQFIERREEALAKRREIRKGYNIPSEVEVQDAIDECERLAVEAENVEERVQRLLETTNPKVESRAANLDQNSADAGSDHDVEVRVAVDRIGSSVHSARVSPAPPISVPGSPGPGESPSASLSPKASNLSPPLHARRRRANRTNAVIPIGLANPCSEIERADAPEKHKQMKQQLAEHEASIAEQVSCISGNEAVMRNAEQTLKVLEEMKTLFLEEVAREKPTLIEAFGIVSPEKEAEVSSESDDSDDDPEGDELADQLQQLEAEQEFLRFELSMAVEEEEDEEIIHSKDWQSKSDIEGFDSEGFDSERPATLEEDSAFVDIRKLAVRVEQEVRQLTRASVRATKKPSVDTGSGSDSEFGSEKSDPDSIDNSFCSEAASKLLQSSTHIEMQELLQLRDENSKMLEKLTEVKQEIQEARTTYGAVDLKQPDGITASPEKWAELQQKVRELQVLRKRWWKERQEDQTTVRRALAIKEFDLGST